MKKIAGLMLLATIPSARALADPTCVQLLTKDSAVPSHWVQGYEATRVLSLEPTKSLASYQSETGLSVVARGAEGEASQVRVRVLSDNPGNEIQVIGDFNGWGTRMRPEDRLVQVAGTPYAETTITGLTPACSTGSS